MWLQLLRQYHLSSYCVAKLNHFTMKIRAIFFIILYAQASASFFDVFRGAMSSVAESFENLVSDVVTDVRDTIDCSILAVKQVLALSGDYSDMSEYNALCRGASGDTTTTYVEQSIEKSASPDQLTKTQMLIAETVKSKPETPQPHEIINDALQNIKQKISNDRALEPQKIMNNTKNRLEQETKSLSELSKKLHNEFDILTEDVKKVLRGEKAGQPASQDIPYNVKFKNINKDATKLDDLINGLLSVPPENKNDDAFSLITNSEDKELGKTEQIPARDTGDNVESIIQTIEDKIGHEPAGNNLAVAEKDSKVSDDPVTFLDVAKKIMKESKQSDETPPLHYGHQTLSSKENESEEEKSLKDYPDYGFLHMATDSKAQKASVMNLIENSKLTDNIFASYLQNPNKVNKKSVFDNLDAL